MKIGFAKTCAFLPKPQEQTPPSKVHISYFLQKCKKGKTQKWDLPFWYLKTQCFWNYVDLCFIAAILNLVSYSSVGDSPKIETGPIRVLSITYHNSPILCFLIIGKIHFGEGRIDHIMWPHLLSLLKSVLPVFLATKHQTTDVGSLIKLYFYT